VGGEQAFCLTRACWSRNGKDRVEKDGVELGKTPGKVTKNHGGRGDGLRWVKTWEVVCWLTLILQLSHIKSEKVKRGLEAGTWGKTRGKGVGEGRYKGLQRLQSK